MYFFSHFFFLNFQISYFVCTLSFQVAARLIFSLLESKVDWYIFGSSIYNINLYSFTYKHVLCCRTLENYLVIVFLNTIWKDCAKNKVGKQVLINVSKVSVLFLTFFFTYFHISYSICTLPSRLLQDLFSHFQSQRWIGTYSESEFAT